MNLLRPIAKRLDVLSYYLTILAVGLAGLMLAFNGRHPSRGAILGLTLAFGLISMSGFQSFVSDHRRRVHGLLSIQAVLISVLLLLAPEMDFYLIWFYMMSVYAIIALPRQQAFGWIGIFTLLSIVLLVRAHGLAGGLTSAVIYASGFAFFAAFARITRQAEQARAESERLLAELQQAHRELQAYAAKAEALAVAEERNRLAREMHDTLGHRLTVAAVQLEAAERLIPTQPERAAGMVATVRGQVRAALDELRRTVAALRQPLERDLPLDAALGRLVDDFRQATGLDVVLELPDALPALSPPQRLTLYRAAQEGLTNAHKHAAARRAWVTLTCNTAAIRLAVRDDGRGPQGGQSGFGLRGLHERAAHLGGEVRFGPAPAGGALLEVILPL